MDYKKLKRLFVEKLEPRALLTTVCDGDHFHLALNVDPGLPNAGDTYVYASASIDSYNGSPAYLDWKDTKTGTATYVITPEISSGSDVIKTNLTSSSFKDPFGALMAEGYAEGVKSFQVNTVGGTIKEGMGLSGGKVGSNQFNSLSRVTSVTSVGSSQFNVEISHKTTGALVKGAGVTFSPTYTEIEVDSLQGKTKDDVVKKNSAVFGGASGSGSTLGNIFPDGTYVTDIVPNDKNDLTKGGKVKLSQASGTGAVKGAEVKFTPPLPSPIIGTIGQSSTVNLCIVDDHTLTSARFVFTLGQPGNFPFNNNHTVAPPVPYKGNVQDAYYDFVEFTWTANAEKAKTQMNINTSTIDQFGLPITIEFGGDEKSLRGIEAERSTVFANYKHFISHAIQATTSPEKVQTFFGDLATAFKPDKGEAYRILAPADAFAAAGEPEPPVDISNMEKYFDPVITEFFDNYETKTFYMTNVAGNGNTGKGAAVSITPPPKFKPKSNSAFHDLSGKVIKLGDQRVLRLTDITEGPQVVGKGWQYDIYEPFFEDNGYAGMPKAPDWLVGKTEKPTAMVFGGSGVFATSNDNATMLAPGDSQPTPASVGVGNIKNYQTLLGAIENQIVTAFNRGIALAPQWRWLVQATDAGDLPPQVTVLGNSNKVVVPIAAFVSLNEGMNITGASGIEKTDNFVTDVTTITNANIAEYNAKSEFKDNNITLQLYDTVVTLSKNNVTTTKMENIKVTFSNFEEKVKNPFYQLTDPNREKPFSSESSFENKGIWNYFSQAFHLPYKDSIKAGISIDGLAYAYAYDDQGGFSTDISVNNPDGTIVTIGSKKKTSITFPVSGTAEIGHDPFNPTQTALFVSGTESRDGIRVTQLRNGDLRVRRGHKVLGTFADVDGTVIIQGLGGNDLIAVNPRVTRSVWLDGGAGNDRIIGGRGNDYINGGDGNDLIVSMRGNNVLIGGDGRDRIIDRGWRFGSQNLIVTGETTWNTDSGLTESENLWRLEQIWETWNNGDSLTDRVDELGSGTDPLLDSTRVIDDGDADFVFGRTNLDWLVDYDSLNIWQQRRNRNAAMKGFV